LYEGFGLPLLEAMACGAPVVTSNVPGIVETVDDVARLVSPTDFRELAQVIAGLLQDDGEREYRSEAGLKHSKKFSWERTASATLEVYEDVISQKQNRIA
jgi:glycosyltransferase involved in cell wall biosynthesis